jgi:hypothetical protein
MKKRIVLDETDIRSAVDHYLIHKGLVTSLKDIGSMWVKRNGSQYVIEAEYYDSPRPSEKPKEEPRTWHERLSADDPKK